MADLEDLNKSTDSKKPSQSYKVEVALASDILFFPEDVDQVIDVEAIVFNLGKGWTVIEAQQDTVSITDIAVGSVGGKSYESRLEFFRPGTDEEAIKYWGNFINEPVYIKTYDCGTDTYRILGTNCFPAQYESQEISSGGDARGANIVFLAKSAYAAFVVGAVPLPTFSCVDNGTDIEGIQTAPFFVRKTITNTSLVAGSGSVIVDWGVQGIDVIPINLLPGESINIEASRIMAESEVGPAYQITLSGICNEVIEVEIIPGLEFTVQAVGGVEYAITLQRFPTVDDSNIDITWGDTTFALNTSGLFLKTYAVSGTYTIRINRTTQIVTTDNTLNTIIGIETNVAAPMLPVLGVFDARGFLNLSKFSLRAIDGGGSNSTVTDIYVKSALMNTLAIRSFTGLNSVNIEVVEMFSNTFLGLSVTANTTLQELNINDDILLNNLALKFDVSNNPALNSGTFVGLQNTNNKFGDLRTYLNALNIVHCNFLDVGGINRLRFEDNNWTEAQVDTVLASVEASATLNNVQSKTIWIDDSNAEPSAAGKLKVDALRALLWSVTVTGGY